MKRAAFLVSVFAVIFALTGCIKGDFYRSLVDSLPTVSVQGTGKVTTTPDEAVARFGVTAEDKTLAKAYAENTVKMNSVIETVKGVGVDAKDIQTSSYSVAPVYPRNEQGRQIPGKPVAFRVSQQITVKVRDIQKTGEVIDKVIMSGTNTFSGIQFASSRIEELKEEAKIKASKDAEKKALDLAKSLNVKVGRILKVDSSARQPYPKNMMMAYEAAPMRAGPVVEAGSMEVTATCNIIYEIIQ